MSPDENVGPTLLAITGVVTFLVLATTAARIYVRVKTHNTGWDDYLIVAAAILATLRFAFQVVSVPHGFGRHAQYVDPHDVVQGNKWSVFGLLVLFPAICFVKMSIILLLLRIKNDRWLKIVLGVVVVGLVVTNFGTVFTIIGQCHPLSAWWNNIADCGDVRIRLYWIYTTVGTFEMSTRPKP
jgi:hypothetical protein